MLTKDLLLILLYKAKLFAFSENEGIPKEPLESLHVMVMIRKNILFSRDTQKCPGWGWVWDGLWYDRQDQ